MGDACGYEEVESVRQLWFESLWLEFAGVEVHPVQVLGYAESVTAQGWSGVRKRV